MEVSEQIIQVLDKICEKFGIIIDWTNYNIMPYIQELMNKMVNYEIATSIVWIILGLICILTTIIIYRIYNKKLKEEKKGNINDTSIIEILIIIFTILSIISIITIISQIFDIVQATILPEKTIIEYIKPYLN